MSQIGPYSTYSPPGVYTQTVIEPAAEPLLGGVKVPVFIGTAKEAISVDNYELIRGSSSVADTPIYNEDAAQSWVASGTNQRPVLGGQNGNRNKLRVRNFPIVNGQGKGQITNDIASVSVTINGEQTVLIAVDGSNGIVTLGSFPAENDVVLVTYFYSRSDVKTTDDVSSQVTVGSASLIAPKSEPYNILVGSNTFKVTVDDGVHINQVTSTITLTPGQKNANEICNEINANSIVGLTASVSIDNNGMNHVKLESPGNITISDGNVNSAIGFNAGDKTNRKTSFVTFEGPIVDGSNGGITTTDPADALVTVDGRKVVPIAIDGKNRVVTLPFAPKNGSKVSIEYYFNSYQDTFDYLPNSNVSQVKSVGISPGRSDYVNGVDFIVVNDKDQSKIQWGTAFTVEDGNMTGQEPFGQSQIIGMLVDDKIYGVECERYTDNTTYTVSTNKFILPIKATTGNGRDTPLGSSLYQTVTNGRMDLPTNRPDLIEIKVGKTFRDANSRPSVSVLSVDDANNVVTLSESIPADWNAYATFWYNRITDDKFTFSVVTPGPSGTGAFRILSDKTGVNLMNIDFGNKSGLAQDVKFPSNSEYNNGAFHYGGNPVSETVTVRFTDTVAPATHASVTLGQEPYDLYQYSKTFGNIHVDGSATQNVDLSQYYAASVISSPLPNQSVSFLSTDKLCLIIDGISINVALSSSMTLSAVVTAINNAISVDTTVHADGTQTFDSLNIGLGTTWGATLVSYGTEKIIKITGRNGSSSNYSRTSIDGVLSNVSVVAPVNQGDTDASIKLGFTLNKVSYGSWNAINHPASMVGSIVAPFSVTSGYNDVFAINVDGFDVTAKLPTGPNVTLQQVVDAINVACIPSVNNQNLISELNSVTSDLISKFNGHQYDNTVDPTKWHILPGSQVASQASPSLNDNIVALNNLLTAYNTHITNALTHQSADNVNIVSAPSAYDLQSAVSLSLALKNAMNAHMIEYGVHGSDDLITKNLLDEKTINFTVTGTSSGNVEFNPGNNAANSIMSYPLSQISSSVDLTLVLTAMVKFTNTDAIGTSGTITVFDSHLDSTSSHLVADTVNKFYYYAYDVALINADETDGSNSKCVINYINQLAECFYSSSGLTEHYNQTGVHVTDDTNVLPLPTTNIPASTIQTAADLLIDIRTKFYAHMTNNVGGVKVHGNNDTVNKVTASYTSTVARQGNGIDSGKLVIDSQTNMINSLVAIKPVSPAAQILGFALGSSVGRVQPNANSIACALNNNSAFASKAVASDITVSGLGTYVKIDSLSVGSTSTISFSSTPNTAFVPGTGLDVIFGRTGDNGESAQSGFVVTSSLGSLGSNGYGYVGQTYTDSVTGLRFTILQPDTGSYANNGIFTFTINEVFKADASKKIFSIGGLEMQVYNTNNTGVGTTAFVNTFSRTGAEPAVGDYYYVSYDYKKSDTTAKLFVQSNKIIKEFGPPTPDYPLSLAARIAQLNGAPVIGLKQVIKQASTSAMQASFKSAIDELKKPIGGRVMPDVIVPLTSDVQIGAYLNEHCVFMSSPRQGGERTAYFGADIGTNPNGVSSIARSFKSEFMTVVYPDVLIMSVQDPNTGVATDHAVGSYYAAAAIAASTCNPAFDAASPLTRRQIYGFKRLGRVLDPTEANQVAVNGVTILEQSDDLIRIRHGLTTNTDNVITRTPSVILTIQFVQKSLRRTCDPFIGQKLTGALVKSVEKAINTLFDTLIGSSIVSKVSGLSVEVDENDPTIIRVSAIYVPVFPLEYIVASLSIRVKA